MSIIGPRPLLVSYLNYYTETERHRHDVRPGLTGLAQVNGRSFITWEEIFQYDLQYVSELTFGLDIKIVFLTMKKVFFRDDIADASTYEKDENGQLYVIADGKKFKVHSALNEERSYMAIEMKQKGVLGKPCPDYVDETVSMKVVRIIQGYVNVVNKMVWRKDQ